MSTPRSAAWRADEDVAEVLRDLVLTLSDRQPDDAMRNLLIFDQAVHDLLRSAARELAGEQSWAAVGSVAGTSREAAWQRWGPHAHTGR